MTKGTLAPEFPVPTTVLLGFLVTAEVLPGWGFSVSQEKFILQSLCPCAISQEDEAGVRVPDTPPILHLLPFQIEPDAQEALMFEEARTVGTPLMLW
ncbi:MAG: hypothetical protein UU82_C0039G0002 [Candidatus Nomurabacteria bacterium GW2011_GWC2_41_8]|uniref:Uncharacterized protein n=1 Tax=Candidatus Nomurabacteria bacterium GW2011_GWC2_41_8 TaxID=1618755 RepID=A0A0G0XE43_9BACT|nr:MAG: hypothetical protein UU82_C0039G0002 [Candidatus Nomurabacteria bacterium GW2011_GWC2_41_8]